MQDQMDNFKEIETVRKKSYGNARNKSSKNPNILNSPLDTAKGIISEHEDEVY